MKTKYTLRLAAAILFLSVFVTVTKSQDTAKIMSYNLLNYSGGETKNQNFRKTIKYSDPDILLVCEIINQTAVNDMLANVMNYYTPGLYSAGTFINGFDTDNAIFYKTAEYTFLSNLPIQTDLRDINMFTLIHNASHDTISMFEVHLKASNTSSDQQKRLVEVNYLRTVTNSLPAGTEFMVMGDFNIYTANEPAYLRLLEVEATNEGQFVDPYNLPGTWNQASYSIYHSQSTRVRALSDGGATGGLDDRFDFILNSTGVTQEGRVKYIPGSLKSLGNDGNHYNDSINKVPNNSAPDSIINALYYGSDHLPVYALYKFDSNPSAVRNISSSVPYEFKLYQNYPNPFNPTTKILFDIIENKNNSPVKLIVYDALGKEVSTLVDKNLSPGSYEAEFDAGNYTSGVYYYKLSSGNFSFTKSMVLLK